MRNVNYFTNHQSNPNFTPVGAHMSTLIKVSISLFCALGVTAALAQTVQPRGATQARPPVQTAQAPVAGGAASGASATTAVASSVGVATAGAVTFITVGVVAIAGASQSSEPTVTHTP